MPLSNRVLVRHLLLEAMHLFLVAIQVSHPGARTRTALVNLWAAAHPPRRTRAPPRGSRPGGRGSLSPTEKTEGDAMCTAQLETSLEFRDSPDSFSTLPTILHYFHRLLAPHQQKPITVRAAPRTRSCGVSVPSRVSPLRSAGWIDPWQTGTYPAGQMISWTLKTNGSAC